MAITLRQFFLSGALLAAMCSVSLTAQSGEISVDAHFDPQTAAVGERVRYLLTFQGARLSMRGLPPQVDGLEYVGAPSEGTQIRIVNGRQSVVTTYAITVSPEREGEFTIPSYAITFDNQRVQVPSATLRVVPSDDKYDNAFFLEIQPDTQPPYFVGQAVPAALKLYVRTDINFQPQSLPTKEGDAFAQAGLQRDFQRLREVRNGTTYDILAWPLVLTPLKSGDLDLRYTMPLVVAFPNRSRPGDSIFGQNSLFNRSVFNRQSVDLPSRPFEVEVRPLPTEDQPEAFTGAIGQFLLRTEASTRRVEAGNPVTLRVEVSGEGNFDRVAPPQLPSVPGFRIYDPEVTFEGNGDLGYAGKKIFEYVLIPESDAVDELPRVPFAYFDPRNREYVDLTVPASELEVFGSLPDTSIFIQTGSRPASADVVLPIELSLGSIRSHLRPLFAEPAFLATNAAGVALLLGFVAWRKRQEKIEADPHRRRLAHLSARQSEYLKKVREAADQAHAAAFYSHAYRLLQVLAAPASRTPESLADDDLRAAFVDLPDSDRQALEEIIRESETARFAGSTATPEQLAEALRHLEAIAAHRA